MLQEGPIRLWPVEQRAPQLFVLCGIGERACSEVEPATGLTGPNCHIAIVLVLFFSAFFFLSFTSRADPSHLRAPTFFTLSGD